MRLPFGDGTIKDFKKYWRVDAEFGEKRKGYYHSGADINLKTGGNTDWGEPLRAIADGEVTSIHTHSRGFGKHIHIKHEGEWGTVWSHYAHCDNIFVGVGGFVQEGQKVATLGNSGNSKTAHLHFSIKLKPTGIDSVPKSKADLKKWTDPIAFIDKWSKIETESIAPNVDKKKDIKMKAQTKIVFGEFGKIEIQAIKSKLLELEGHDEYKRSRIIIDREVREEREKLEGIIKAKTDSEKERLRRMVEITGTIQDWDTIIEDIKIHYKRAEAVEEAQQGVPLTKHPFEGIGEKTRQVLDLVIKKLKMPKRKGKQWYESKTVWFNAVSAVVIGLGAVVNQQSSLELPGGVFEVIGAIVTVGNFILRFVTTEPIKK